VATGAMNQSESSRALLVFDDNLSDFG